MRVIAASLTPQRRTPASFPSSSTKYRHPPFDISIRLRYHHALPPNKTIYVPRTESDGHAAMACQVPVFRFALERWTADKYEIVVIHDGPLTPEARSHIERLQSPEIRQFANFDVHVAEARSSATSG